MHYLIAVCVPVLFFSAACHEANHHENQAPSSAESQVNRGHLVYAANCARCHGDQGEGRKGPPLIGKNALPLHPRADQKLRTQPFHTALDVAQFVTHSMPPDPDNRSKIAESDYWAVLAFDLDANGIAVKEPLGPHNAKSIVIHP